MENLKWIGLALLVIVAWLWLRNGISAAGTFNTQFRPAVFGNGMIFSPNSAWTQQGYYPSPVPPGWSNLHNLSIDYSPDNGAGFNFAW